MSDKLKELMAKRTSATTEVLKYVKAWVVTVVDEEIPLVLMV